jgi:tight adherence protein B
LTFGLDGAALMFIGLATLAVAGMIYGLMYDRVASETKAEKRLRSIHSGRETKQTIAAARTADAARRRKSVQDSLKDLEQKQAEKTRKSIGLKRTILQAGLKLSLRQFVLISLASALFFLCVAHLSGMPTYAVAVAGIVGGFGAPRWVIARMRNRRMNKFLDEFPNAVDVIVRGVKAGLPVNDCLAIIAKEAKQPVSGEFIRIIEAQQMGQPLNDAIIRLYQNVPVPEANFFAIVIAIQQSAGGNLSEALNNLSIVLRDRKKMKQKISAMSAEAKASAMIIGALPFIVAFLVYLTTPEYIKILFTSATGHIIMICAGLWMAMGILVMKKMISFDF